MNPRCDNCGQLALDTDKVCWHCGRPLDGRDNEAPEKVAVNKGWQQTQSLGTIGGYVVVAVVVIVAALLVTNNLSKQPRVSASVGDRVPEGWEVISDLQFRYSFYLPQDWTWFEPVRRERREDPPLTYLLEKEKYFLAGMNPFQGETEDLEIDFLAVPYSDTLVLEAAGERPVEDGVRTGGFEPEEDDFGDDLEQELLLTEMIVTADAFMIVAHSTRLNTLTYTETAEFLLNSDYRILEAEQVVELDRSFLTVSVETPVETAENFEFLRCSQQFFLGRDESLLVTLCAKDTVYTRYQRSFNEILTNFRRLFL
jgi:hypothetical protein